MPWVRHSGALNYSPPLRPSRLWDPLPNPEVLLTQLHTVTSRSQDLFIHKPPQLHKPSRWAYSPSSHYSAGNYSNMHAFPGLPGTMQSSNTWYHLPINDVLQHYLVALAPVMRATVQFCFRGGGFKTLVANMYQNQMHLGLKCQQHAGIFITIQTDLTDGSIFTILKECSCLIQATSETASTFDPVHNQSSTLVFWARLKFSHLYSTICCFGKQNTAPSALFTPQQLYLQWSCKFQNLP